MGRLQSRWQYGVCSGSGAILVMGLTKHIPPEVRATKLQDCDSPFEIGSPITKTLRHKDSFVPIPGLAPSLRIRSRAGVVEIGIEPFRQYCRARTVPLFFPLLFLSSLGP